MNKVVRYRGNNSFVPQEAGNLYVSKDKVILIGQDGKQYICVNEKALENTFVENLLLQNKIKMLEEQLSSLKRQNVQVISVVGNVNEPDKDVNININETLSDKHTFIAKSININKMNISNGTIDTISTQDVEISSLSTTGELNKSISNAQLSINNIGIVKIVDSVIGQDSYNGIEIGLLKTVKSVLIDNVKFTSQLKNNAISVFDTQEDSIITISNCVFEKCSNPLRLSNRSGNKVTVNFINCEFMEWEKGEYAGCVCCQDYTSKSIEEAQSNNLFNKDKVTINFINCNYAGNKINFENETDVSGTKNDNQLVYVYGNKEGFVNYSSDRYPNITVK